MVFTWKSSIPMLLWFVVLAILSWQNVLSNGFYLALFIAVGLFLLIPVLVESGLAKGVAPWVRKAGIFVLFSAAFKLVEMTTFGFNWKWLSWFYDFGLIVAGIWLLIAAIIGFFKWK